MLTLSQGTVFKTPYSAPSMSRENRSILTIITKNIMRRPCSECIREVYLQYTQKNFGTRRSIFVCCTEDIYKFVSRTDPFECSPCGTRSDSTVTGKFLFVTRRLRHFERGGDSSDFKIWNIKFSLSHIETIKMKLNGL
jgi:hypothetical protein